ncbi:unnamed protein product (macronuclear) [Paramecium tetraurelia]|uniref:Trichocyst matrix protein n=1 Tax=Paramecium tetraurelia TaxID=5888 RepID=A0EFR3_PARTE|nr:uncharacterized protein GSPATT00026477001 [Paramecium tetraurelia]CAK94154.1 unnamed protein product [Paramecium tetraurelia]|eukprot:XP_001461527.1 hypothetical protein (macronuclear) [Paramecium tetraurelia strain d4-2]
MPCKLLILLAILSVSLQFDEDVDVHEEIEKLKQSQFGQTILDTVQIQLSGPEPLQNLINMLQNLNTQLEGEQDRDDRLHERYQSLCENDLSTLEDIINESTSTSKLLKGQIDQLEPDKQAKLTDLARTENELKELKNELEYQTEKRKEEQVRYEKTLDNLEQGLYALNEAKKMFNTFLNVLIKNQQRFASLIQVENQDKFLNKNYSLNDEDDITLVEIAQQINKIKHNVKAEGINFLLHGISHIVNLLSKDPTAEQESMSRKVLEIISQVDNWIQKQRIYEDLCEQQRKDAFGALAQMLEDQIILKQENLTFLQGSIESLNSQITSAKNEKAEVDVKIETKTSQNDDRDTECRNEDLDYQSGKNKRDKEREELGLVLDLVINKIGQLKKEILQK